MEYSREWNCATRDLIECGTECGTRLGSTPPWAGVTPAPSEGGAGNVILDISRLVFLGGSRGQGRPRQ
jgi:hypothetical protein